jgi:hypothetical protein
MRNPTAGSLRDRTAEFQALVDRVQKQQVRTDLRPAAINTCRDKLTYSGWQGAGPGPSSAATGTDAWISTPSLRQLLHT